ncbi:MAG: 8-oxo-dGTP diphosphatase MutT [Erysipelotrichaceae bacterium]|nr:8-oxo-dGTP diphosphatase MutT [Erysipelotrichaceae bacterium]
MKNIHVAAAIIIKEDKIFCTQRGYGEFKDMWEFPGGKLEIGETSEQALVREIKEELNADIKINEFLCTVDYTYPTFHLTMDCFICSLKNDHIELLEAENAKFLKKQDLNSVDFLPADIIVVEKLINRLS